jgi:hypothetical protein
MEGHKSRGTFLVQRAFLPTRLSDDFLTQAYEHVLHRTQQEATSPPADPTRSPRRRKRLPRVTTTGGRKA